MIVKIAFRNALRQRRRSVLTALTMFGGFVLAAISIGWSDGSYSYIIEMFTRNRLGHIQVHKKGYLDRPSLYKTIDGYRLAGSKIQGLKGVEAWAPRLYSAGLVSVKEKSATVQVIGIDPDLEQEATRFNKKITQGTYFRASHPIRQSWEKGWLNSFKPSWEMKRSSFPKPPTAP